MMVLSWRQSTLLLGVLAAAILDAADAVPISRDDVVISIPIDEWHMPLARASRSWRRVRG